MNCIGIIGAMETEVARLKEMMEDVTVVTKASMEFYQGTLKGKKAVVVRSGIGKVNNDINIGDIVLSTDVVQHDVDAGAFGYKKGEIPQMGQLSFPADAKLRQLAADACREVNPEIQVFQGRIASGDQFICDRAVKNDIRDTFGAYAVEMEGAAIGQAAWLNQVPFLIIRAISDNADDSTGMEYNTFERLAAEHSVRLTEKIMETL